MCNSHDKPIIKKRQKTTTTTTTKKNGAGPFNAELVINTIVLCSRTWTWCRAQTSRFDTGLRCFSVHVWNWPCSGGRLRLLCNHAGPRLINGEHGGLSLLLWCLQPCRLISSACVQSMALGCLFSVSSLSAAPTPPPLSTSDSLISCLSWLRSPPLLCIAVCPTLWVLVWAFQLEHKASVSFLERSLGALCLVSPLL